MMGVGVGVGCWKAEQRNGSVCVTSPEPVCVTSPEPVCVTLWRAWAEMG